MSETLSREAIAAELPAAYEPVWLDKVTNLRKEASSRAASGAPEGTLLVASDQSDARGAGGKIWESFPGNLHASIVLEPEIAVDRYHELLIAGLVSLGQAIAAEVAPMTALTYSWPNDINVARNKIASMWMDFGSRDNDEPWLVLTASVNVTNGPGDFSIPAMSLHEAEGSSLITPDIILIGWCRQLISHLNDWDSLGFTPLHKFWSARLDLEDRVIKNGEQSEACRLVSIDNRGAALVESAVDGTTRTVDLTGWLTRSGR